MLNIIVCGSTGKYGRKVLELAHGMGDIAVVGQAHQGHPLEDHIKPGAVIVDFSVPAASAHHAQVCSEHGMRAVIATTGLNGEQMAVIQEAAQKTAIVFTPNTSLGVNMVLSWMQTAADCMGSEYAIDIKETHHTRKKDAPSGTALRLAKALTGKKVPIKSVREGEIVGIHSITFMGPNEKIVVTHEALNPKLFAEGALLAVRWVADKPAGLYDMQDVLGLK